MYDPATYKNPNNKTKNINTSVNVKINKNNIELLPVSDFIFTFVIALEKTISGLKARRTA